MGLLDRVKLYSSEPWEEVGRSPLTAGEIAKIKAITITESSTYFNADETPALSICLHLKSGEVAYVGIERDQQEVYQNAIGTTVSPKSVEIVELERDGKTALKAHIK